VEEAASTSINDAFLAMIHPKDRDKLLRLQRKRFYDIVYRIILPEGAIGWLHEIATRISSIDDVRWLMGGVRFSRGQLHGHTMGDLVLKQISHLFRRRFRQTDVIGRVGGEEFAVLLFDVCPQGAGGLAEEIREALSQKPFSAESGGMFRVSVTGGPTVCTNLNLLTPSPPVASDSRPTRSAAMSALA
jgi:hypothetical protein